jgi:prepilin peptidase CpaA
LPPTDAVIVSIAVAGSVAATVIDVRTRRVPNALTGALAFTGVAVAAAGLGRVGLTAALAGGLVGCLVMLPGHLLGATGGGDVKLLAAGGTLLGPGGTLLAFLVTALAGGVLALIVAAHRGRLAETCRATAGLIARREGSASEVTSPRADNRFAYAPAIAVGMVVAAFRG